jgi:uncharacterized membrane protein
MSNFLALNTKDFIKGLIVAVISALIAGVLQLFQTGPFLFDWATFQPIVLTAISAGLAYLSKNLFTNSGGEIAPEK